MALTKAGRDGNNGEQGHKLHSLEWDIRSYSVKLRRKGARNLLSNIGESSVYHHAPRFHPSKQNAESSRKAQLCMSRCIQVVALSIVLHYTSDDSCMSQQSAVRRAGP
jgi:hypothetical protein